METGILRKLIAGLLCTLFLTSTVFGRLHGIDLDVYTAPAGTSTNPATDAANWTKIVFPCVIPAGGIKAFAFKNKQNKDNKKTLVVTLTGTNLDSLDPNLLAGWMTDGQHSWPTQSEITSSGSSPNGTSYLLTAKFIPQPEWEVIEFAAVGAAVTITAFNAHSFCYDKDGNKVYKEFSENKEVTANITFGYEGGEYTIEADEIVIFHDTKTLDVTASDMFIPPTVNDPNSQSTLDDPNTPTGTWSSSIIYDDPKTDEPKPQGGWRWICLSSDRGIWENEAFTVSLTTTEFAGGTYWLLVHDRLRDEWIRWAIEEDEVEYYRSDLDQSGDVNFSDFAVMAEQWLLSTSGI